YLTPEQLLARYLQDGDCENGPGPVYSAADLAANCDDLMTFIAQSNPTFPTTVSGEIAYEVSFDSLVVGPCCSFPCTRMDTAEYRCEFSTSECTGIAVSGGFMTILSPCPDLDFDDSFIGYETNLVSLFDPNGYVNDFYYFSDPERTVPFDPATDYIYDGDGCLFGSNIIIYTSLGCDLDQNGVPNGYVNLGTVTPSAPMPFPSAPTVEYSLNGDMDCVYEAVPHCWDDDITPSIPIEICGASDLDAITFSVLSGGGCVMEHTVVKPSCPDCGDPGGCVSTTYAGGSESVCSNSYLAGGFPSVDLIDANDPFSQVFWSDGPIEEPGVQIFQEPQDQPNWEGPMLVSDPASGLPETQVFFAYSLCDDDADPMTPAVYIPLGEYEVIVEPIPDGRITPVCIDGDSLNFYIEVELFSNAQSNTLTASNSVNSDELSFSTPSTQLFGPYANGTDVSVTFSIDGGCSFQSETFNTACLSTSCVVPEIIYSDTCFLNPGNGEIEYWIETRITGATVGYLFEVTNDLTDDTTYMNMFNPVAGIGPFSSPQTVEVVVADYTNGACFSSSEVSMDQCLLTGITESETDLNILLYPNPARGFITLQTQGEGLNKNYMVSMYDVVGKLLIRKNGILSGQGMNLSLSNIGAGVYLIRVRDEQRQTSEVLRFVKE
ncbi:MAG: T9SS type A sorting domain-containing protein, partial [Flavobacteriales bacterium]|nr:T9SS type A sorting domain-containing protein [Flavobacteriales bacterium]